MDDSDEPTDPLVTDFRAGLRVRKVIKRGRGYTKANHKRRSRPAKTYGKRK